MMNKENNDEGDDDANNIINHSRLMSRCHHTRKKLKAKQREKSEVEKIPGVVYYMTRD